MTERVTFIIKKLNQLVEDNASADILLANAQLLVAELQEVQAGNKPSIVSVTIPQRNVLQYKEELISKEADNEPTTPYLTATIVEEKLPEPVELNIENEDKSVKSSAKQTYLFNIHEEEPITSFRTQEESVSKVTEIESAITPVYETIPEVIDDTEVFDSTDIPTLPKLDEPKKELNERLAKEQTDINDKFKVNSPEIAHLHEDSHIRDLKKAISINEKYLFINNLFGRNEDLYDKSIKHIQSFSILAEASFWIQKELKTKLGWSEEDEIVQLFDQFVRRRFS